MEFMCVRVQHICLHFFGLRSFLLRDTGICWLLCFLLLHTGAGGLFCFFLRTGIIYNCSVCRAFSCRIIN